MLDIYAAGETPIEGISAQVLVERMQSVTGKVFEYQPHVDELLQRLTAMVRPGDVVMTLGAGNVWQLGERLLELLKDRSQESGARSQEKEGVSAPP